MGPYCKYCTQRCFVRLPKDAPACIAQAYFEKVGNLPLMATCPKGQAHEKAMIGYCYADLSLANGNAKAAP